MTTIQGAVPSHHLDSSPSQGAVNVSLSDVFPTPPKATNFPSSPAPKMILDYKRAVSTPPEVTNENYRRTSGKSHSGELPAAAHLITSWDRQQLSKKRSQYHGEVFAYREPHNTAKDRITRDSVIMVEIKLNRKLEVKQTFLSDISFQLSEIYQRPESCMIVSVCTLQAMLFAGSSEPAYYMTITALASEIAPTKNKRSTALVQDFMHESLDIAPRRGIIRFEPVLEENLATNGVTALQEIEEISRNSSEDGRALRTLSRKSKRSYTPAFMERVKTPIPHLARHEKTITGENEGAKLSDISSSDKKRLRRRKSIMAFFGR